MKYQYWMGTEDSLLALQQLEAEVAELRKAAAQGGERQAFLFFDDLDESDEDTRLGSHLIEKVGEAGVIKVSGSLVPSHDSWHRYMSGRITSYEALIGATQILAEDDTVKRVIMKVGSGGGAVSGVSRASEAIRRLDRQKPVISHVDSMAFSAGYWLASASREVVAGDPMAEFGSIGTLMVHMSRARMAEEMGIDVTVFRAGEYKAVGHPMEQLSDEAKAYLQADVEKANSFFLEHVSKRRNLMVSAKSVWAEGKTFFAAEAQSVGLVDRVEPLDDLLIRASGAANHHNRSYGMKISQEKLARIEAGARPEDVLTAEELKDYQAAISADLGEDESEDTGDSGEDQGNQASQGDESSQEGGKQASETSMDLSTLLKDNGRLEARLEAREERITELEAKLTSQQESLSSLMAVGLAAVHNRQMALGKAKTEPQTVESMLSTFNELEAEMAQRFRIGQQSRSVDVDAGDETAGGIPRNLQLRKGA